MAGERESSRCQGSVSSAQSRVILEKVAMSESFWQTGKDVPLWVNPAAQSSNFLLCRVGWTQGFPIHVLLSPAQFWRCSPELGNGGGTPRLSEPLFCFFSLWLFAFSVFKSWTSAKSLKIKSKEHVFLKFEDLHWLLSSAVRCYQLLSVCLVLLVCSQLSLALSLATDKRVVLIHYREGSGCS